MAKKRKVIIGGVVVLVAALILVYVSYMGIGTYYYNVRDLLNNEPSLTGKNLRVSGILLPDPSEEGLIWYFTIQDVSTEETLPVVYNGTIPDTFKVGNQLVVEGQYDADSGIFEGRNIIVKCRSKYSPATIGR